MEELNACVTKHVKMSRAKKREPVQTNILISVNPEEQAVQLLSVTDKAQDELPPMPQLQRMGTFNYTQELNFNDI